MAADELGYRMFDADNHYYEGEDAFTRHLAAAHRGDFFWVTDDRGHRHIIVNGRFWNYIPNPTFDPIALPGSMEELFAGAKSKSEVTTARRWTEPLANRPEYRDRAERLARMDHQCIEKCWMFPTMVSGLEHATRDNIPLTYALLNALNRYILDEWGFDHQGRIYAPPVVSLADRDEALAQLEFGIAGGARAIMLRPAPAPTIYGNKSPADPMFDRFWARCAQAGVVVTCHAGETGYHEYAGDWTGRKTLQPFTATPAHDGIFVESRAVMDFAAAMICHGAFTRHPDLKVVMIENGSAWVPELVRKLKKYYAHHPQDFTADPVAQLERHLWVSPFWEDDIKDLAACLPVEHILAGSDWPHAEGLAEPAHFVRGLAGFSPDQQKLIMRENGMRLVA